MAVILNIETAADICSLSLSANGETLALRQNSTPHSHGSLIAVFANELKQEAESRGLAIEAVAISAGPGSYTGLRIGCSFAKGFCFGTDIPLIAISTLKIMAAAALNSGDFDTTDLLCPMLDARRMEVYYALYDAKLNEIHPATPKIIDEQAFTEYKLSRKIVFFGNGAQKCKEVIKRDNISFIDNVNPTAQSMAALAENAFEQKNFVNLAYFEPDYLKDFIITTPKHKVF